MLNCLGTAITTFAVMQGAAEPYTLYFVNNYLVNNGQAGYNPGVNHLGVQLLRARNIAQRFQIISISKCTDCALPIQLNFTTPGPSPASLNTQHAAGRYFPSNSDRIYLTSYQHRLYPLKHPFPPLIIPQKTRRILTRRHSFVFIITCRFSYKNLKKLEECSSVRVEIFKSFHPSYLFFNLRTPHLVFLSS